MLDLIRGGDGALHRCRGAARDMGLIAAVRGAALTTAAVFVPLAVAHADFRDSSGVPLQSDTSACQAAPMHIAWQLDARVRLSGAVVSGLTPACYEKAYRLTVFDASHQVAATASGRIPSSGSTFTVRFAGPSPSTASSVDLSVSG
jgi:hypothetical protein